MNDVRTDPLTPEEIASFHEHGYLFPIRVLDDAQVEEARAALDDHLEGRRQSQQYELTDPIVDSSHGETQATVGSGAATSVIEEAKAEKKPHSVPFLFNLWERDERFWKIDADPVIAGMARQLLGSEGVVLMEDGAVIKKPVVGGKLAWHQDYAYWPLATPAAVTCWIALDDVGGENGGMMVAAGSHSLGEKLPVEFGDGSSFMHDERPGIGEVQRARGRRARGRRLRAQGRRVRLPRRPDLARVGPEHEPEPPARLHPALRRDGDDLARRGSLSVQLHRRRARVRPGRADPRPALPAHRDGLLRTRLSAARHAPVTRRQ